MEDWEEAQEATRAKINKLKDHMSQILEALTILKSKGEATTKNDEVISTHLGMSQTQDNNTQGTSIPFPQYGLPPGYTPPLRNILRRTKFHLIRIHYRC